MKTPAEKWLGKLTWLNPNRSKRKGAAPHKPALLLSVIELAEAGELLEAVLTRSPGLQLRFQNYIRVSLPRWGGAPDLRLPFHHLGTQRFWTPLTADGEPSGAPETTKLCRIDPGFFKLLQDPGFRERARMVLVHSWYPAEEQLALAEMLGLSRRYDFVEQSKQVADEAVKAARQTGRDARFRIEVVSGYHHTCALTGYSLMTGDGATIVEAAHIRPFARSRNDQTKNGLALSRSAHWLFDQGLWSVSDEFRILVARERFSESGPEPFLLRSFAGRLLQFAPQATLRPDPDCLRAHRREHGFEERR